MQINRRSWTELDTNELARRDCHLLVLYSSNFVYQLVVTTMSLMGYVSKEWPYYRSVNKIKSYGCTFVELLTVISFHYHAGMS